MTSLHEPVGVGFKFSTDKGVGKVIYAADLYLHSLHLNPAPQKGEDYQGEITIVTAFASHPDRLQGAIYLNSVVEHASASKDLVLPNGATLFTAEECEIVSKEAWNVLIDDYGIGPNELVLPKGYEEV